jgi:hypothetical protein
LLDADLVAGKSNGYLFRMVIAGANEIGAPAQYELSATPATYGRTGKLSFSATPRAFFTPLTTRAASAIRSIQPSNNQK